MERPLRSLAKAHLHLHFTGSMRPATLLDLAHKHRIHLPDALASSGRRGCRGAGREGLVPLPAAL